MLPLSVVVPTFNRRARLARVLKALDQQHTPPAQYEVVVVDDGSTDGTSDWLRRERPSYTLRQLSLPNGGPARARNAGVEAAVGNLILFIDDDVEPLPELLAEHLAAHRVEPDVVVIGPLGSLPHYSQPWVAWEQAKVESQYEAMTRGDWAPTFRQFWTGNASVSRRHLQEAGLFDPSYLRAEDIELGIRLHQQGLKFRFNARARALHHAERSLSSWENMHASYGRHEVAIFAKLGEPQMLEILRENWNRLHPVMRALVGFCLNKPRRHSVLCAALRADLKLAERAGIQIATEPVCSVLASLLYWQASFDTLGPARAEHVLTWSRYGR